MPRSYWLYRLHHGPMGGCLTHQQGGELSVDAVGNLHQSLAPTNQLMSLLAVHRPDNETMMNAMLRQYIGTTLGNVQEVG